MGVERRVEVPGGVTASFEERILRVTGPKGTLERTMRYPQVEMSCDGAEFVVSTASDRRKITAMCGTFAAHARNMFKGVVDGYEYQMKVVYSHFPIQLKMAGTRVEITNFLGEREPRYARIDDGVEVKLGNDEVIITGIDKDAVGSTAARIEAATRVRHRDPRVFQDGIYIVGKA
ncbi:MAG TPA: 50S ribosomal protein L6 [Methanoculleus sp.]|nr:50S ribosomal protein L6 [Methanoculleus sp.]